MSAKGLTPKQQRFVDEYLIDLNATQAAIRAGYSEKTARSQGQRLLTDDDIAAAIQRAQDERAERTGIDAERVLQELGRIGFSDIRALFTPAGNLLPPEDWPDSIAAAVSSVEVVTRGLNGESHEETDGQPHGGALKRNRGTAVEYVHKIKLWDKNSALEKIAKHLGMFTERVQHDVTSDLADLLRELDGKTRGIPR